LKGLRFIFEYENLLNELEKRLKKKPADLIIIDCFADIFGNDLKDSNQIRAFLNNYQQLAQKNGCLVLFLHHTGKRTENSEPSKNNLLSGQGFEAKMRLVIELRADQLNTNKRHLCIVKGNYLPGNYKKESYVLIFDETNFSFQNTNERVPFELLVKREQDVGDKEKYIKIIELKTQGITYENIAEKLGFASKGSISKLIDKGKKNGW
jgi:RecA-family ATPase